MAATLQETEKVAASLLVLILFVVLILLLLDLFIVLPIHTGLVGGGILWAIIVNTVVGFIIIWLVNTVFHLGIRYNILVFLFIAIFGLLAVAIIIILRLLGVRW